MRRLSQSPPMSPWSAQGKHLLLRIIEHTITEPALPGFGQVHRLATTVLDDKCCSALDLGYCYHERWEIELVIDEVDDHRRLARRPLRSLKPLGVTTNSTPYSSPIMRSGWRYIRPPAWPPSIQISSVSPMPYRSFRRLSPSSRWRARSFCLNSTSACCGTSQPDAYLNVAYALTHAL